MRYDEFKKEAKKRGYKSRENKSTILIGDSKGHSIVIWKKHEDLINAYTSDVDTLKLAIALVETPLDERMPEKSWYVCVIPDECGYLGVKKDKNGENIYYIDDKIENYGGQTKFTKLEIEQLKKDPQLKGINFDGALEEVKDD